MQIFGFFLVLCTFHLSPVHSQRWGTLNGMAPLVIAKGGFSGIFPDSGSSAYGLALMTSGPDVILWCDVQLTKDNVGICLPDVNLRNATNISSLLPENTTVTYQINGESVTGWFSVDFLFTDLLSSVSLVQGIYSRNPGFDSTNSILSVSDVVKSASSVNVSRPKLWLNIQHDLFFRQHNLSMTRFLLSLSRDVNVLYISSPEIAFLRSIPGRFFNRRKTKLIFRFLDEDAVEPSTKKTYASLSKNLTFIKTFASGIIVPKSYIWPVSSSLYLLPHTSIVLDAHKEGLGVFASEFANDIPYSYNYSYDPLMEYLSYVDNGDFSVDGVLSSFPVTASAAIGCYSHSGKNSSDPGKPLIMTHNGASGIYPGCTDLAYKKAIEDGADFIDCPVQVTKDQIPVCLPSINLFDGTNIATSQFGSLVSLIPELASKSSLFSFNLTWEEIKTLKPLISNPYFSFNTLLRNPAYKNEGAFMTLSEFLSFAKENPSVGSVIEIENAAFLAEKLSFSIVDSVIDALNSSFKNEKGSNVIIKSTNSSTLVEFKRQTSYKIMYQIDEDISDATDSSIIDIKRFADSVAIKKASVYPSNNAFLINSTVIVQKFQAFNLSVYTYFFRNEFVSQAWDYFSDPTIEINTHFKDAHVDGVISEFPGTAKAYRRNSCMNKNVPYMPLIKAGGLAGLVSPSTGALPPAPPTSPVLTDDNVIESPLPSIIPTSPSLATPTSSPVASGHHRKEACTFVLSLFIILGILFLKE